MKPIIHTANLWRQILPIVCLGCVTKDPGRCIMSYRDEKEKQWEQCRVEMVFSCVKYELISRNVIKLKQQVYNNSVIALVQRFIFVWTVEMNAALAPYKNKSLNSFDEP